MSRYAEATAVTSESSRAEIERTLARYGASRFFYGWDGDAALVGFQMNKLMVQFKLPLPERGKFALTPEKRIKRSPAAAEKAYEQAVRQSWRALALVIKARLEAVESGIESFQEAFLAHIMVANDQTVGDRLIPEIEAFYAGGRPPQFALPRGRDDDEA